MSRIFIDTNIFYNVLFETKLTQIARKLLEDYEESLFHTGLTVVNELLYISARKYCQAVQGVAGSYSLRRLVAKKGYSASIMNGIQSLLKDLEVRVLVENIRYQDMIEVASCFRLLPSDAIVALTCKHYNIEVILTFDGDFKRVAEVSEDYRVPLDKL